jgi:hypothetical protein
MFEKLENRRMFAVSDPVNGVVTITGTDAADEIRVRIDNNGRLEIQDNFDFRLFVADAVTGIVINGLGGADTLDGGSSSDFITTDSLDVAYGGTGKDCFDGIWEDPARTNPRSNRYLDWGLV